MKIDDAIDGYWLEREIYLTQGTVNRYGYALKMFREFMGNVEVSSITSNDIKMFLRHLHNETDLSGRYIYDCYSVLSAFWTWAEQELGVEHIIKGKVDKPKYTKRKIEPLTMKEVKKLVKAMEWSATWASNPNSRTLRPTGLRDKAIVLVMVDCGIRVSELCDLQIKDYHKSRGRLYISHGKGDKERFLPLGSRAKKALWRYLASRPDARPTEPLFCTQAGTKLDRNNVRRLLKKAADRAGITSNVHPHKLRHTFAIEFLRNGGNPFELKELLGHETLTMVMNYVAISETDLENAQKRSSPADNWRL